MRHLFTHAFVTPFFNNVESEIRKCKVRTCYGSHLGIKELYSVTERKTGKLRIGQHLFKSNLYLTFLQVSPDCHVQMGFRVIYYNTIWFLNLRIIQNFSGFKISNMFVLWPQNRCSSIIRSILNNALINKVQFKQSTDLYAKNSTPPKV